MYRKKVRVEFSKILGGDFNDYKRESVRVYSKLEQIRTWTSVSALIVSVTILIVVLS